MRKQTGNKVLGLIFEGDIQGLKKMNLAKKDDISEYSVGFFEFAVEKEQFDIARYLYEKVLQESGIPDHDVEKVVGTYLQNPGQLSFIKKDLSAYAPFIDEDMLHYAYKEALKDFDTFSELIDAFKGNGRNKRVLPEVFEDLFALYGKKYSEEEIIKFWDKIFDNTKIDINHVTEFLGEITTLFTDIAKHRQDCRNLLDYLKEKGLNLQIDTDGYSYYAERAIEDDNAEALKFLIDNGANVFVPKREGCLSAYSMAEISEFWEKHGELREYVLKKHNKPFYYESLDYKAHEAFTDQDIDTFIQQIEEGAAYINHNIKCKYDTVHTGYLARLLEMSVAIPKYIEAAKIVLNKYENKEQVLMNHAAYTNPYFLEKCIELGLDPNAKSDDSTTCFYSSCHNFLGNINVLPVIKRLIEEKGCDPTIQTDKGETLLDDMFEILPRERELPEEHFQFIDYLFSKGCSVSKENMDLAAKYPRSLAFFERVVLKYADVSEFDFEELLEHYTIMKAKCDKDAKKYQESIDDFYSSNHDLVLNERNNGYINNKKRLLAEEQFAAQEYGKLMEKAREMIPGNSPSM